MNGVPGDVEMPLSEHFKELRSRISVAVIPVIIITLIVFIFSGKLMQLIWDQTLPEAVLQQSVP